MSEIDDTITANITKSLGEIPHPSLAKGSNIYGSTKIFPDYQAEPGQSYFTLVHGIAHESSVSFVAVLQATRAMCKDVYIADFIATLAMLDPVLGGIDR